jgi:hypothetical protein
LVREPDGVVTFHAVLEGVVLAVRDDVGEAVALAVLVHVAEAVTEGVGYGSGPNCALRTGASTLPRTYDAASPCGAPGKNVCMYVASSTVRLHTSTDDAFSGATSYTLTVAPTSCVIWQSPHQSAPRLATSMRTMAARHGSTNRIHCGAAAEQRTLALQKFPTISVGGYVWSTTPSAARVAGVAANAELAVTTAARARL